MTPQAFVFSLLLLAIGIAALIWGLASIIRRARIRRRVAYSVAAQVEAELKGPSAEPPPPAMPAVSRLAQVKEIVAITGGIVSIIAGILSIIKELSQ